MGVQVGPQSLGFMDMGFEGLGFAKACRGYEVTSLLLRADDADITCNVSLRVRLEVTRMC